MPGQYPRVQGFALFTARELSLTDWSFHKGSRRVQLVEVKGDMAFDYAARVAAEVAAALAYFEKGAPLALTPINAACRLANAQIRDCPHSEP